ncbi:DUF5693 family protein [Niameybacter massiliensis]|uniref:DUF5693 family protein n=1 Tax=Niameybacter massiliensis TaxID=1658108 RepID=UPI0006B632FB|nr:DUF5693 family protein [Niameybacter massiliensis]
MKKQSKIIISVLIVISLCVCGFIGARRINVEQNYRDIQVAIRYSDVLNIARQTNEPIDVVLKHFNDLGANALFVRENTVLPISSADYVNFKDQGKATVYEGYELEKDYPESNNIRRSNLYIEAYDEETFNLIYNNLTLKGISAYKTLIEGEDYIEVTVPTSILTTLGVGYNYEHLQVAADLGYVILPQVKSWDHVSDESIEAFVQQIEAIPNLGTIYFADSAIVEPKNPMIVEMIEEHGLGFVEFFSEKQKGFETLAKTSSQKGTAFNVERLHTVTDAQVKQYTTDGLMDRYMLALTERNLRTFLFKMPNTLDIEKDANFLGTNISTFTELAETKGYTVVNEIKPYNLPMGSYVLSLLAGLGAILVFVLLLDYLKLTKVGYILGALGLIGYAGLLKVSPDMGIKLMALFGAVIYPTYGVTIVLDDKERNIKETILAFIKCSVISFGGALTIIGVLSRTSFGLGINVFAGVKAAMLLPIVLVLLIAYYERHGLSYQYYKDLLSNKVTYLALGIMAVGAVVLLVYTSRTGNTGSISPLELAFRQFLDTTLGVRPRTKEFLIGHPLMLVLLYYGYKDKYIPLLVLGAIGQISLVNTYAHIHTPVLISLIRMGYGLIFGIVIGLIFIGVTKLVGKVINKWVLKNQ